MRSSNWILKIKKYVAVPIVLLGAAILGWLLLMVVYSLPHTKIAQNVAGGIQTLLVEGAEFEYASGYKAAILDNQTEAVMLSEAVFPSNNPIRDSLSIPRYIYSGRDTQELSLMAYLNNDTETERIVSTYPRYWHGYLVPVKIFFSVFDFADSRMFHLALQLFLVVAVLYLLDKRGLREYILPFVMVMALWNMASTGICMQYYACFYVTIFAVLFMLWRQHYLSSDPFRFHMFFLVIGIATSYFDFLTYPIATLGIPLVMWVIGNGGKTMQGIQLILNAIFWGIGYLGMWLEKWILSSIVLKENVVLDAVENVASRTSVEVGAESVSRVGTIVYLFQTLIKWPYVIMFGIALIGIVGWGIRRIEKINTLFTKKNIYNLFTFGIIALLPCVWFFVTANHSYVHPRLVYRGWGVSIFAIYAGLISFFKSDINEETPN